MALTDLQHHLGHPNPAITLRVYSHWFSDSADTVVADKLAEIIADHPEAREIEKSGTTWALKRRSLHRERRKCLMNRLEGWPSG